MRRPIKQAHRDPDQQPARDFAEQHDLPAHPALMPVKLAAQEKGIEPSDLRAWGAIFQQAARDKHIRRSEVLFQRARGNGSLAQGWIAI